MTGVSRRQSRAPSALARWMATKSPAERRAVVALSIVVAVATLWAALWLPLTRDTTSLRLARAANASALASARDHAKEISELSRTSATVPAADARAALDRALVQQKARPAVTSLDWRDGRAHVVFAAISFDGLIGLLEALQRDLRLRTVEATITARVEPGIVRAELTLAR